MTGSVIHILSAMDMSPYRNALLASTCLGFHHLAFLNAINIRTVLMQVTGAYTSKIPS